MKQLFLSVVAASALLFTACGGETTADEHNDTTHEDTTPEPVMATYNVDVNASTLEWKGSDLAMPEGHFHTGTVAISGGSINTTDGMVTDGTVTVDMSAIGYNSGAGKDGAITSADTAVFSGLLQHLASDQILNTGVHNTAVFNITGCDNAGVNGTLKIMGQDIAITIPGKPTVGENLTHSTDWFEVDLTSLGGMFAPSTNEDGTPGMQIGVSIKLDLTATK